jgi:hypothetical protein
MGDAARGDEQVVAIEGLSIRLYHDHNFHERFAVDLRRQGFDLVIARELGHQLLSDEDHLLWATGHGRTLLTHDLRDFVPLARKWNSEGRQHAGIILCEQPGPALYGLLLHRLLRLLDTLTAEEMLNRVEWLDKRWDIEGDNR